MLICIEAYVVMNLALLNEAASSTVVVHMVQSEMDEQARRDGCVSICQYSRGNCYGVLSKPTISFMTEANLCGFRNRHVPNRRCRYNNVLTAEVMLMGHGLQLNVYV
jgi:hypothetical protein